MDRVTIAHVLDELKELNSRIDGLYGLLITGDIQVPNVITHEICKDCQAATRASIAEIKATMISKLGFWSGVGVLSVVGTLLMIVTTWAKLIGGP